ncbi:MAG: hypothetical protein L6420_08715, partial [Elusimicrobia bacterium]|nr:hypothetical protein [Elusimicrobiota bacterium]
NSAAAIAYSKLAIADADLTIAKTSGLQAALDGKVGAGDVNTFTSSQTIKGALGLLVDYEIKAGSMTITTELGAAGIIATDTTSSRFHIPKLASTDFETLTPSDFGDLYYNTTLNVVCVSTGTTNSGDFSRMDGTTSCW